MNKAFEHWCAGYGPIRHTAETAARIKALAASGRVEADRLFTLLAAADRLSCAAMWTIAHMTYAKRVDLSGAPLDAGDFKPDPQGHTGGSLNMAPAFCRLSRGQCDLGPYARLADGSEPLRRRD